MLVGRREDPLERRRAAERAAALLDVRGELVAPLVQVAIDRIDGELAERTEDLPEDVVADRVEQLEVGVRRGAVLDRLEDLHHPACSDAARRALAARLVRVELRRADGE